MVIIKPLPQIKEKSRKRENLNCIKKSWVGYEKNTLGMVTSAILIR